VIAGFPRNCALQRLYRAVTENPQPRKAVPAWAAPRFRQSSGIRYGRSFSTQPGFRAALWVSLSCPGHTLHWWDAAGQELVLSFSTLLRPHGCDIYDARLERALPAGRSGWVGVGVCNGFSGVFHARFVRNCLRLPDGPRANGAAGERPGALHTPDWRMVWCGRGCYRLMRPAPDQPGAGSW